MTSFLAALVLCKYIIHTRTYTGNGKMQRSHFVRIEAKCDSGSLNLTGKINFHLHINAAVGVCVSADVCTVLVAVIVYLCAPTLFII